jgi:hypothetical protein
MSSKQDEFGETTMEWFEAAERKDHVTPVTMTLAVAQWYECLVDHGLFQADPTGKVRLADRARASLQALNEALAAGDRQKLDRLNARLKDLY